MDINRQQTTYFNCETRSLFLPNNRPSRHWAFTSDRMCPMFQGIEGSSGLGAWADEYSKVARQITHKHNNFLQHRVTLIITLLTFLCKWHLRPQRRNMLQQTDGENLCIESVRTQKERERDNECEELSTLSRISCPIQTTERERERSPEEQMEGNIYE